MRTNQTILTFVATLAWLWTIPAMAQRQLFSAPTPEMAMTTGSVAEVDDRAMTVRAADTELLRSRYRYTSATRWVNDAGAPVSRQSVRPGASVTVHYQRGVEGLEASRVILHSQPVVAPRNLLSEMAAAVAALPPNNLPGARPEVLGPPLPPPPIAESPAPAADPPVKRRVARNIDRPTPAPVRPVVVPKKRNWLATLFAPRGP